MATNFAVKEVWDETWTLDNLGHLALWLLLSAFIYFAPKLASALIIPTLWLFNREKLQWNCKIGSWKFWLGWPWQEPKWSWHKNAEWLMPSIGGVIILLVFPLFVW